MFKSKARPIIVTQAEHGRLSGILASLWGNDRFDRPKLNFTSFVLGVTYHDRGYGLIDNTPIGEADQDEWKAIQKRGIVDGFHDDPIANIVALLHIKRLLVWSNEPELIELAELHIRQSLIKTDIPIKTFEWADKITRLCDNISFDYSFEAMIQKPIDIYPRVDSDETVTITHRLGDNGEIFVKPWTFSVDQYSGFITGYNAKQFPDHLDPVYMPFTIRPDD